MRSYRDASPELAAQLSGSLASATAFLHVTTEALRVPDAVEAMRNATMPPRFGSLLLESHASLRDRLHVSCPALDRLVEAAHGLGRRRARG